MAETTVKVEATSPLQCAFSCLQRLGCKCLCFSVTTSECYVGDEMTSAPSPSTPPLDPRPFPKHTTNRPLTLLIIVELHHILRLRWGPMTSELEEPEYILLVSMKILSMGWLCRIGADVTNGGWRFFFSSSSSPFASRPTTSSLMSCSSDAR